MVAHRPPISVSIGTETFTRAFHHVKAYICQSLQK